MFGNLFFISLLSLCEVLASHGGNRHLFKVVIPHMYLYHILVSTVPWLLPSRSHCAVSLSVSPSVSLPAVPSWVNFVHSHPLSIPQVVHRRLYLNPNLSPGLSRSTSRHLFLLMGRLPHDLFPCQPFFQRWGRAV